MTEKLKQTIEEEVEKLPKEIQEVIKSSDWVNLTEEIGREYLLDEIQLNNFQLETLLVLVNLTDIRFLAINIENQAGVTKGDASAIATETSQKIFTPIYNILSENVKKALKNKKTNWEQNLGFVLSGGDYSAFITPTSPQSSPERRGGSPFPFQGKAGDEVGAGGGGSPSPLGRAREGLGNASTPSRERATPQEGNKNLHPNTPTLADIQAKVGQSGQSNPQKTNDLRDQFKI